MDTQSQNATGLLPLYMPPAVTIPLGTVIGLCVIIGVPVKFVFFCNLSNGDWQKPLLGKRHNQK